MTIRSLSALAALSALLAAGVASAGGGKLATLEHKNGFRGAKLGAEFTTFADLRAAGKRDGLLWFTREGDKLSLFETRLSSVTYGFRGAILDRIVVTGAWTLDPTLGRCEGNNDHILANLKKVFGKPTATHAYSSSEGKRCISAHGGGLKAPYCRVQEWKSSHVRLSFFAVMTTTEGTPPPDVEREPDWTGHSCRFALEYARVINPADDL